jgi:hypothetical protein
MSATSRSNALTALAPLAPWRLWWCRLVLPVLRILAMSSSVARLRSIHFGGWIVFGRLPSSRRRYGWRSRPSLLFLSNYDGQFEEYIAAFGIAAEPGMRLSFGSAEDFPGTRPSRRFVDYVEQRTVLELWNWSAYPGRTVRDVDTALEVSTRLRRLVELAGEASDRTFETAYHELLEALVLAPMFEIPRFAPGVWQALHRSTVDGVVIVAPLEPGRGDGVRAQADEVAEAITDGKPTWLDDLGGVHFARLAILPVAGRSHRRARQVPTRDYLLLAAWVDGSATDFLGRLVSALDVRADALFGACAGYPGSDDPAALTRWIEIHRLRISLFFRGRTGVPVAGVHSALDGWERATAFADGVQGQPLDDIRRAARAMAT